MKRYLTSAIFAVAAFLVTAASAQTTLQNGVPISNISGSTGSQLYYQIYVPSGQSKLEIKISGGTGDCDLYVKRGTQPTLTSYDYRPYLSGNNETVTVSNPASGYWYIMLRGYSAYSGVTLKASYSQTAATQEFFDDFAYSTTSALTAKGWTIKTGTSGPGISDATWSASNVSFLTDPLNSANKLARLTAYTSGQSPGTVQAEIYRTAYKYRYGTYAARIYFRDKPSVGSPDGDVVVETFFVICPWNTYYKTYNYSELDFEYLPNGGWGRSSSTMLMTSWEIAEPPNNVGTPGLSPTYAGWRTLVIQATSNGVRYYIDTDTNLVASHPSAYAPETSMAISFNLWFDTLVPYTGKRSYWQDIDWVFFAKDQLLSLSQVQSKVNAFRASSVTYKDTVQ
jgi:hypothetical protein